MCYLINSFLTFFSEYLYTLDFIFIFIMVKVDEAFELRYKKDGNNFEVLIDFDKLNEFKLKSNEISVYDVLADSKIFKDQKKGDLASPVILKDVFKTDNEEIILKEILLKGEPQIPTAYLNKLRAEKKIQVVNYIVENSVNPQTKSKFTFGLIESEVSKIKFNFEPFRDFNAQAEDVLKLLKKKMPISMEKIILVIEIPGVSCGNFYGPFRKYGKILRENYNDVGNLVMDMEMMESRLDDVANFIKLNSNAEGSYFIKKE